jgi:hypothetical protein
LLELVVSGRGFQIQQFAIWTITDNPSQTATWGWAILAQRSQRGGAAAHLPAVPECGDPTGKYGRGSIHARAGAFTLAPIGVNNCILERSPGIYWANGVRHGVVAYTYQGEATPAWHQSRGRSACCLTTST